MEEDEEPRPRETIWVATAATTRSCFDQTRMI